MGEICERSSVRLSYADSIKNGVIDPSTEIIEENNYYPFGLKHSGYNNITGATPSYQYKYNGKELQETGMYAMDWRSYMPDIGRFTTQDAFTAIIPDWTPYRFAFNNPVYFSDPTGLLEESYENNSFSESFSNALAICPNCPKTSTYQPFIDDPNNEYYYDSETGKVSLVKQIEEVVVIGKKKDSTLDNLDFANDRLDNLGDLLSLTKNKGGSIGIWTTPIRNRAFDGINYSKLNIRYYGNNWRGNLSVGRTTSVAKYLKKGSIVGSIIIGIVETGQGLAKDKSDYETKGQTNGRNTVKAATTATAGIVAGIYAGAAFGTAIPIPIVGTIGGAIVGGIAGYLASEATGAAVDAVYDKIEE